MWGIIRDFCRMPFTDLTRHFETVRTITGQGRKRTDYSDALIRDIQTRIDEADLEYLEEEIPLSIKQTLEGVGSISKIVRSMKEFSHPGSDEKMLVDINRALESTITVAKNEWKYVAEMKTDFDPLLPPVPCFPGELNQVFLNIIINAAHAIGERCWGRKP